MRVALELGGCPDLAKLWSRLAGALGALDRVGGQDLIYYDRVAESLSQYGVHILDGARREAGAISAAAGHQVAVIGPAGPSMRMMAWKWMTPRRWYSATLA